MIEFTYLVDYQLNNEHEYTDWINNVVQLEGGSLDLLNIVFADDETVLQLNKKFLNHDWYTDILTFDEGIGGVIKGEIVLSLDRVRENSEEFKVDFKNELNRVIIHGVLHMLGYNDDTKEMKDLMRGAEDKYLKMFHVEQ